MSTRYDKCGPDVTKLVKQAMKDWHTDLHEQGVTVQCVFAYATDKKGRPLPGVKRNGVPGAAKVGITSLQDRARGIPDAKVTIDGFVWDRLDEQERVALIDHELEHLQLKGGKEPRDDLDRPKLKMKRHDWEVWGFESIVKRHGVKALDFQAAQQFRDKFGQLLMWAEDQRKVG